MEKKKILLALIDNDEMESFSNYLGGIGFGVIKASDGAKAVDAIVLESPAITIIAPEIPAVDGEKVFQISRNNPKTANTPFFFVSDRVLEIKGFRPGKDVFLLRPLKLEELFAKIRDSLSSSGGGSAFKEIEGRLAHMPLTDIVQFLNMNRKEGELRLTSGSSKGIIYFKDGHINNCVIKNIEREKAMYRLLSWTDGKFEFVPSGVTMPKKINASPGSLMMEGMRQIDEHKKKEAQFPANDAVLKLKVPASSIPKGLQPIIYDVIQLAAAHPKVEDLVEHCPHTDYEVYTTIAALISKGVLEEQRSARKEELLTHEQAMTIKDRIISLYPEMLNQNFGKILIISASGEYTAGFLAGCKGIPGFSVNRKAGFSQIAVENPLGEVGSIKAPNGMEFVIFSMPSLDTMEPLRQAFSSSLVGVIAISGAENADEIFKARDSVIAHRGIPAVSLYFGGEEGFDSFRKASGGHVIFKSDASPQEVLRALFDDLVKGEHIIHLV